MNAAYTLRTYTLYPLSCTAIGVDNEGSVLRSMLWDYGRSIVWTVHVYRALSFRCYSTTIPLHSSPHHDIQARICARKKRQRDRVDILSRFLRAVQRFLNYLQI